MGGGLIQLSAFGTQDIYLSGNPQITFFKVVYRRHTNFSTEVIPQYFTHQPDFGKRVTCILSREGDLIRKMHLVVSLPKIPPFKDRNNNIDVITKFAWTRRIGFALIKRIEIEIDGELIDRQYGDWLNIWNELAGIKNEQKNKMLGEVKELTEYTNGKKSYQLFIPLQFWFCRAAGLALPIVGLQYNHIKVNLEINEFKKCRLIGPTHYITIQDNFVNFNKFEYLSQTIDGITAFGRFIHFDIENKRLYYTRITNEQFKGIPNDPTIISFDQFTGEPIYYEDGSGDVVQSVQKYLIIGTKSKFQVLPKVSSIERTHVNNSVRFATINLKETFLLVEYIYLDIEERVRFSKLKHEYLIEQILFDGEKVVDGLNSRFKLGFTHPCKELIWVVQRSILLNERNNDLFNYTNNLEQLGKTDTMDELSSIVRQQTITFNGEDRISLRNYNYYNYVQPWQHHSYSPSEGINVYSFSLYPENHQPSGTANFSKIDDIRLRLKVLNTINFSNPAKLRTYAIVNNVLKIVNGISGLVFSIDN